MTGPRTDTRPDLRALLTGLGALLLLVSLFLDWYGDPVGEDAITAWSSFELLDVLLAALALAVLYEALRNLLGRRDWPALTGISRIAGPAALVLVVVSLIDDPPLAAIAEADREVGIWLALAGALLMTIGSLLGRVRISFESPERETRTPASTVPPHDPDSETRTLR